jgi:Uncharacterized protein conserved in bacteria
MSKDDFSRDYSIKRPLYEQLESEVRFIIDSDITINNIKINKIESRIKSSASILDKMDRKMISKPFEEITDILGIRIVCLFISDIKKIENLISDSFTLHSTDDKINIPETETFGYMSLHLIASIKDNHSGPRYDNIKGLKFEIQIRTMTMDAWANISHYLDYKSEHDIPKDLKKDFHALSGLFYVADKHFELFHNNRINEIKEIRNSLSSNQKENQEINIDTLAAFLELKFPDREKSNTKLYSELVDELYQYGYKTTFDLEQIIDTAYNAFLEYEKDEPPYNFEKYSNVGAIRGILDIVDIDYFSARDNLGTDMHKYRALIKQNQQ